MSDPLSDPVQKGPLGDRFTRHGAGPVLWFSILLLGVASITIAIFSTSVLGLSLAGVLLLAWGFMLSFFRNPKRIPPAGEWHVLSAADGKVTGVARVEDEEFIGGPATRVSIFLSVLNVHVNRAPVAGSVEYLGYRKGTFRSALDRNARETNECQAIGLQLPDGRRVLVRQIAGQIARRIVCPLKVGEWLAQGFDFGMIRFGSQTEVSIAERPGWKFEPRVQAGDSVRGGVTVLGEWRKLGPESSLPAQGREA